MAALWWIPDILHVFFFLLYTFFFFLQFSQQQQQQQRPDRFLNNRNLNCIALCEGTFETICTEVAWTSIHILTLLTFTLTVITSNDLQKHGNIWVCPTSDHVCTRFLFVWVYGAFRSFTFGKTSVMISGKLHFPPLQVWERPGRRCPRQHSGSDDPQRNLTSHLIKVMLTIKSVKWRRRSLISQKRGTNLTW